MTLSIQQLARMFECGRIEPNATKDGILSLCKTARECSFGVVFANLGYLALVVDELKGSGVKVGVPIAFPFGATSPEVKSFEAKQAMELGAEEFDMVMNVARLKSGDCDFVYQDIKTVVDTVGDFTTKVILETCWLTKAEIIKGSEIARSAGATFVKTSTGYGRYCARVVDVQLIQENVDIGIKAAGDIEDLYTCLAMIRAGASRIGANPEDARLILREFREQYGDQVDVEDRP